MATVQEIKEALLAEQQVAVEASQTAIGAIDTMLNLSMWTLGIFALLLAGFSIWGVATIRSSSEKKAKKVANGYLKGYISGEEFKTLLDRTVNEEVKRRLDNKFIVANISEEPDGNDADPFPNLETEENDDTD